MVQFFSITGNYGIKGYWLSMTVSDFSSIFILVFSDTLSTMCDTKKQQRKLYCICIYEKAVSVAVQQKWMNRLGFGKETVLGLNTV